jgi:hypothetical protein
VVDVNRKPRVWGGIIEWAIEQDPVDRRIDGLDASLPDHEINQPLWLPKARSQATGEDVLV